MNMKSMNPPNPSGSIQFQDKIPEMTIITIVPNKTIAAIVPPFLLLILIIHYLVNFFIKSQSYKL